MHNYRSLLTVLFISIASGFITGQDTFLSDFKLKWQNAGNYTIEFAKAMPETHYGYTPTPVEMTYREQLKHVAGNIIWLCSAYLDGSPHHVDPMKTGDSKKEIIAMLEKTFVYATQTINNLTENDLNEKVDFVAGKMTRRRVMLLLADHVTHHRGQLVVYLRMKNVEPPKYVGW